MALATVLYAVERYIEVIQLSRRYVKRKDKLMNGLVLLETWSLMRTSRWQEAEDCIGQLNYSTIPEVMALQEWITARRHYRAAVANYEAADQRAAA